MKKIFIKLIQLISILPFAKSILSVFYFYSIKKIREHFQKHPHIKDIILTSDMSSSSFIYGLSDLNFLIIVENNIHPKIILNEFRDFIKYHFILNFTVQKVYIPILTIDEINTDIIKSYLIRDKISNHLKWISVLTTHKYDFKLSKQDYFSMAFSSFGNLDFQLLQLNHIKSKRLFIKAIYKAIHSLKKIHPKDFSISKNWEKTYYRISTFPLFIYIGHKVFMQETWNILSKDLYSYEHTENHYSYIHKKKVNKYLSKLLKKDFIDDITMTPALIQQTNNVKGKLYFDIHLNHKVSENLNFKELELIKNKLKSFDHEELRYRVRFTTSSLYQLQNRNAYYPFPLEPLFRKRKTLSYGNLNYNIEIHEDAIHLSSVHFLVSQFMRFRSFKQKTDLIGSKFIKSLNLMYRYYLLSYYLKGNEVEFLGNEKIIRERLTPQFNTIKNTDIVTEEQWRIIKAQLLYLLKDIRNELAKKDPTLKKLKF